MMSLLVPRGNRRAAAPALFACLVVGLAACTTGALRGPLKTSTLSPSARSQATAATHGTSPRPPLPAPAALVPFARPAPAGTGDWHPAGRLVDGMPAVYETTLVPPGAVQRAGIAWLDTKLLSARLYSGSVSPGGLGYKFTAPVLPGAAATLVAAFNGGFKMSDAHGGYYTEGKLIDPLVTGDASVVIYASGAITVGAWGADVSMTRSVVAVRQNLVPLVAGGRPTPRAAGPDWRAWGNTCGLASCAASVPGIEHQWRSGLGVTADGALVYAAGPALNPLQLAQLLVRAGVVRGMELDINPGWPVFAAYRPAAPNGPAAPSNGSKLLATRLGAAIFFQPSYARDFITMSARRGPLPSLPALAAWHNRSIGLDRRHGLTLVVTHPEAFVPLIAKLSPDADARPRVHVPQVLQRDRDLGQLSDGKEFRVGRQLRDLADPFAKFWCQRRPGLVGTAGPGEDVGQHLPRATGTGVDPSRVEPNRRIVGLKHLGVRPEGRHGLSPAHSPPGGVAAHSGS
jgi:hypothetical protein